MFLVAIAFAAPPPGCTTSVLAACAKLPYRVECRASPVVGSFQEPGTRLERTRHGRIITSSQVMWATGYSKCAFTTQFHPCGPLVDSTAGRLFRTLIETSLKPIGPRDHHLGGAGKPRSHTYPRRTAPRARNGARMRSNSASGDGGGAVAGGDVPVECTRYARATRRVCQLCASARNELTEPNGRVAVPSARRACRRGSRTQSEGPFVESGSWGRQPTGTA
jgi:hypothetical protein